MSRQINHDHYKSLTSHERFVLLIEAMARRDEAEADRLEATCPKHLYRAEDQEFRDRMRRAHMIASWVALSIEGPLAQVRLAKTLHEHVEAFSEPVERLTQLAFLYGREYGKWEAGVIESIGAPDLDALERELESNHDMLEQLSEAADAGKEVVAEMFAKITQSVADAHSRIGPQWREFATFCRDTLGLEPQIVMEAFGVIGEIPAEFGAVADTMKLTEDEAQVWKRNWDRRFKQP